MNSWTGLAVATNSTKPAAKPAKPHLDRAEIPGLIASIKGSTCMIDRPDLIELVEPMLYAKVGRSEKIAERNHKHSEAFRGEIRTALGDAIEKSLGPLSLDWPTNHLANVVQRRFSAHPDLYHLWSIPGLTVIKSEIDRMKSTSST